MVEAPGAGGTARSVREIIEERGLLQESDASALGPIADQVIGENPGAVEQFRAGKEAVIGFLVGQMMKKTGGSANPGLAQDLLRERLTGSGP